MGSPVSSAAPAFIQLVGVAKSFGDHRVLDGLTLDVAVGEVVCIMGPSGTGKTTLLRSVNALTRVDTGTIRVGELAVTDPQVDLHRLRRMVGMVFQRLGLFPHYTALDNAVMGQVDILKRERKTAEDRARGLFDQLHIDTLRDRYPGELSAGQQQRVALARTLAMDPQAILLDEVTAALDPRMVDRVGRLIRQFAATGMAVLASSHDAQFVADVADRAGYLDQGRLHHLGPPPEALALIDQHHGMHVEEEI